MRNNMRAYTKTTEVKAKLFQNGDHDGYITRYTDGTVGPDGQIITWGIGTDGMKKVRVPYIKGPNGYKRMSIGFGREYLCENEGGRFFVEKSEFEKAYKPKRK